MRRADRLFQLVQLLRRRRLSTAAWLAERLEVSERTIYRDVADLQRSGVPVEGEAGVGYVLRGFDLPPMMFTEDELEALVLGARVVHGWSDPQLASAAAEILAKVQAVIPDRLRPLLKRSAVSAVNFAPEPALATRLGELRRAIHNQRKLRVIYLRGDAQRSTRVLRPLHLSFMAPLWLLTAWCELRQAFRNFRVDRIQQLTTLEEPFDDEPGRTFENFLVQVRGNEETDDR